MNLWAILEAQSVEARVAWASLLGHASQLVLVHFFVS